MKSKKASAMSVALALALAPGVMAADMQGQTATPATPQNQAQQPADQAQANGRQQMTQAVNLERASKLINQEIKDAQGKTIGKIQGLAVDATDGRIAYAVVSLQDVPNTDKNKLYALPFQTLRQSADQKSCTLTVPQSKLSQAKSFDKSQWPEKASLELGSQNYQVFGFAPYWQGNAQATGQQGRQQAEQELQAAFEQAGLSPQEAKSRSQDLINRLDAQTISKGQAEQQIQQALQGAGLNQPQAKEHAQKAAAALESAKPGPGNGNVTEHRSGFPQTDAQRENAQPNAQPDQNAAQPDAQSDQNAAQPNAQSDQNAANGNQAQPGAMGAQANHGQAMNGQRWVASFDKVKGKTVNDAQGKKLGTIEDLVIDPHEGRIVYAVVGHGGVFGMGQKLAAVPYRALQVDQQKQAFTLNATEQKLDQNSFSSTNWPDMDNEQWAQRVHTAFGEKPYWQVYGYSAPGTSGNAQQPGQQPGEQATPGAEQNQPGQQSTPGAEQDQPGQQSTPGAEQDQPQEQNQQNNGSDNGGGAY